MDIRIGSTKTEAKSMVDREDQILYCKGLLRENGWSNNILLQIFRFCYGRHSFLTRTLFDLFFYISHMKDLRKFTAP